MLENIKQRSYQILEINDKGDIFARLVNTLLASLILLSTLLVIIRSIESVESQYSYQFHWAEIVITVFFTIEYLTRVWVSTKDPKYKGRFGRLKYLVSPMAIIDLLAILPLYIGSYLTSDLLILRSLRLIRLLKLIRYFTGVKLLLDVLKAEARALLGLAFLALLLILCTSTAVYIVEHQAQPDKFSSIPESMWWAIVTLTTVGYGDVVPITHSGKVLSAFLMLIGIGMIALPAGLLASRFSDELKRRRKEFNLHVKESLSDGIITSLEQDDLEQKRIDLGLTSEEMNKQINEQKHKQQQEVCSKCGHFL